MVDSPPFAASAAPALRPCPRAAAADEGKTKGTSVGACAAVPCAGTRRASSIGLDKPFTAVPVGGDEWQWLWRATAPAHKAHVVRSHGGDSPTLYRCTLPSHQCRAALEVRDIYADRPHTYTWHAATITLRACVQMHENAVQHGTTRMNLDRWVRSSAACRRRQC